MHAARGSNWKLVVLIIVLVLVVAALGFLCVRYFMGDGLDFDLMSFLPSRSTAVVDETLPTKVAAQDAKGKDISSKVSVTAGTLRPDTVEPDADVTLMDISWAGRGEANYPLIVTVSDNSFPDNDGLSVYHFNGASWDLLGTYLIENHSVSFQADSLSPFAFQVISSQPTPTPEPTATPEPTETPVPTETPEAFEVTETSDTVYVTGAGVNLRTGPGTSYDVVTVAVAGTELERTGTTDNNWSRVLSDGKECYISNAFISTEKPEKTEATPAPDAGAAEDTVVITSSANIRKGPGTGYDIIGVAETGTELKRTGTESGWSKVIFNGSEGYVFNELVKVKGSDELVEKTGTLTVTSDVNLREGPSTDDAIIGVAKAGAELKMTGKVGNWYRIEYEGQTAYVNGNLVKEN